MHVYTQLSQLIGNTPMLELKRTGAMWGCLAPIYAKLECFNPQGSAKDRAALFMLETAQQEGRLNQDTVIIEPTSGNTGVGLSYLCAIRGLKLILTMPDNMSLERRSLLSAFGAQLILTPAAEGMNGAVKKARELHAQYPNSLIPDQFSNPANALAHEKTTAQEILRDMDGQVDIFVSAVGTGGTLTGNGRVLKQHNPDCQIVAVEPAASPLLSQGWSGSHKIQGIGANFVPELLDRTLIDEIIPVTDQDAYATARFLAHTEGLLVGVSSGAATFAAKQLSLRPENQGKRIVVILPDTGERYLSSGLFA